jgi:glucosamine-phosphate N-acetyltransferase
MNIQIRELTAHDLSEGFLESLAMLSEVRLTPEQALEVLRQRQRAGVRTFVAGVQGRVVGTASLLLEQKFIHGGGWVGHIEDVAVLGEYQGRGIGSALVRHAVEASRQRGCYKVILDCFEHLVDFYGRLGFRPHNRGLRLDL